MSGKKTLLILIVFVILGAAYYFDQQRVAKNTAQKEASSRLVPSARDKISALKMTVGGLATALKKEGADWAVTAPVAARADRATVDQILDELDKAKRSDSFEVADDKLADYGLKTPLIVAEVTGDVPSGGVQISEKIALGADTPDNAETYARIGDEKQIFTLPNSLKSQLNKTPSDMRDKRAVPSLANESTSLTLAWSTNTLQLAKVNDKWELRAPITGMADSAKVTEILSEVNNAKRSDFVDSTSLNLAAYGLDHPQWSATLYVSGYDPRTSPSLRKLETGNTLPKDATKVYARLEGDPGVFALPQTLLTKGKPTIDELRNKEIFSVAAADIQSATFKVLGNTVPLVRDSAGQWHFADDPKTQLDQAVIGSKISTLASLKAKSFLPKAPPAGDSGLEHPNLTVTIGNKAGTTTETLTTGRKSETEDIVYAEIPARHEYIALDWQEPGQYFLTRDQLVDKSLFNFSEATVQKVSITDSSRTLILVKSASGAWNSEGGKVAMTVDGPKMSALLYGMTSLKWANMLRPRIESDAVLIKTQHLEHPARFIKVLDSAGKELARLGLGGEELKYAYITRGENEYFSVDKARLTALTDPLTTIIGGDGQTAPKPE